MVRNLHTILGNHFEPKTHQFHFLPGLKVMTYFKIDLVKAFLRAKIKRFMAA